MENEPVVSENQPTMMRLKPIKDENVPWGQQVQPLKGMKGRGDQKPYSKDSRCPLTEQSNMARALAESKKGPVKGECKTQQQPEIKLAKQETKRPVVEMPVKAPKFSIYCEDEEIESGGDIGKENVGKVMEDSMSLVDEEENDNAMFHSFVESTFNSSYDSLGTGKECHSVTDLSGISRKDLEGHLIPGENFKEYTWEIMRYLLELETQNRPDVDYMSRQPEVNTKMRSILVDWLVEVVDEYKLNDETLFLAVNYVDRFLSVMSIARQNFQLLGTASLFIASKYEEIYPPEIAEFIFITDDTYSKEQVLKMETLILKVLNLHLSTPTILYFLHRYLITFNASKEVQLLSEYICHLVLLDSQIFFKFFSSEIALASVFLATHNLSEEQTLDLSFVSRMLDLTSEASGIPVTIHQERIRECMQEMLHLQTHAASHPQQAIYMKYSGERFRSVATRNPLCRIPSFMRQNDN